RKAKEEGQRDENKTAPQTRPVKRPSRWDCTWRQSRTIHRRFFLFSRSVNRGTANLKTREELPGGNGYARFRFYADRSLMTNSPSSVEPNCSVFWMEKCPTGKRAGSKQRCFQLYNRAQQLV